MTKRAYVELFSAAVGVDRIAALEPRGGFKSLLGLARSQRGRGAVVIDAHNNWRSRLVSRYLGGADARLDKFYRQRIELILLKEEHDIPTMSQRYSALGEPLGLPAVESKTGGIAVTPAARERASIHLERVRAPYVVIAPGSRWAMKEWGANRFAELASQIVEDFDHDIVLVGDGGDVDASAQVAEAVAERAIDLTGRTSIIDTAAVIDNAAAFIGNDSGLMHLAEAVGVPVLALFGPTVEAFGYYPSLPNSKVVERGLACRPCSRNGGRECPLGTHECLEQIAVAPVAEAFADMMAGQGPSRYVLN